MFRAGLYAHVSTNDQQTLAMQNRARVAGSSPAGPTRFRDSCEQLGSGDLAAYLRFGRGVANRSETMASADSAAAMKKAQRYSPLAT
jgi:hypothetical protein